MIKEDRNSAEFQDEEAPLEKTVKIKQLEVFRIVTHLAKPRINEIHLACGKASHGFGAGADMEFLVNVPDMGVNGADAHAQFIGDFFGTPAFGEQSQDFLFAGRQMSFF